MFFSGIPEGFLGVFRGISNEISDGFQSFRGLADYFQEVFMKYTSEFRYSSERIQSIKVL